MTCFSVCCLNSELSIETGFLKTPEINMFWRLLS
jgi:hypothetical protein